MPPSARPPVGGPDGGGDHLAAVTASLRDHRPADQRETESLRRALSFLRSSARPFDQHADPEHVTGSAVVAGRRGTVLHVHKRLGRWLQPGGHVESGEAPWEAARRETEEETGLHVVHPPGGPRLIHVDVHAAARGHTHVDLRYLLQGPDLDPTPPPGESPEARWFTWREAVAMADDALVGALRAARRQPEVDGGDAGRGEAGGRRHSGPHGDGTGLPGRAPRPAQ